MLNGFNAVLKLNYQLVIVIVPYIYLSDLAKEMGIFWLFKEQKRSLWLTRVCEITEVADRQRKL